MFVLIGSVRLRLRLFGRTICLNLRWTLIWIRLICSEQIGPRRRFVFDCRIGLIRRQRRWFQCFNRRSTCDWRRINIQIAVNLIRCLRDLRFRLARRLNTNRISLFCCWRTIEKLVICISCCFEFVVVGNRLFRRWCRLLIVVIDQLLMFNRRVDPLITGNVLGIGWCWFVRRDFFGLSVDLFRLFEHLLIFLFVVVGRTFLFQFSFAVMSTVMSMSLEVFDGGAFRWVGRRGQCGTRWFLTRWTAIIWFRIVGIWDAVRRENWRNVKAEFDGCWKRLFVCPGKLNEKNNDDEWERAEILPRVHWLFLIVSHDQTVFLFLVQKNLRKRNPMSNKKSDNIQFIALSNLQPFELVLSFLFWFSSWICRVYFNYIMIF